jgi:hypothetical protein
MRYLRGQRAALTSSSGDGGGGAGIEKTSKTANQGSLRPSETEQSAAAKRE